MNIIRALLCNHRWEGGLPSGHSWCPRCARYDDDPVVVKADAVQAWLRRWSPLFIRWRDGDFVVRLGQYRWPVHLLVRVHYRWRREEELPGIVLGLDLWVINLHAGLGSGWQDEDGDTRQLVHLGAYLRTYGLRYIGCWRGHDPITHTSGVHSYTYCQRCNEHLADNLPRAAAA